MTLNSFYILLLWLVRHLMAMQVPVHWCRLADLTVFLLKSCKGFAYFSNNFQHGIMLHIFAYKTRWRQIKMATKIPKKIYKNIYLQPCQTKLLIVQSDKIIYIVSFSKVFMWSFFFVFQMKLSQWILVSQRSFNSSWNLHRFCIHFKIWFLP